MRLSPGPRRWGCSGRKIELQPAATAPAFGIPSPPWCSYGGPPCQFCGRQALAWSANHADLGRPDTGPAPGVIW